MAMSPAEKQRRYRERQQTVREKAADATLTVLCRPLSEYLDGSILEFEENLDSLGISIQGSSLFDDVQSFKSDNGNQSLSALERLTGLAGVFLDAAMELHTVINAYKAQEVRDRISELEGADLPDPRARKQAVADLVVLYAMRDRLSKEFRRSFPEISVKEI